MNTTGLESILDSELDSVYGGMSVGETACRGLGAGAGAAGAVAAHAYGVATKSELAGTATFVGTSLGSLLAGRANSGKAWAANDGDRDTMMGVLGAVPVAGAPFTAITMGKLGWKAGGAACGYGWNPRS